MKHAAIFTRLAQRADPNIPILEAAMDEIARLEEKLETSGYSPVTEEIEDILRSEIAKRDERIKSIENTAAGLGDLVVEKAAEISRLKGVIAKCKLGINQYLKDHPHSPPYDCYATGPITGSPVFDLVRCPGCDADTNFKKALTAIKEIES